VDKPADAKPKKPYAPPQLTVYGNVRDLTQTNRTGKFSDGGGFPRNKTTAAG